MIELVRTGDQLQPGVIFTGEERGRRDGTMRGGNLGREVIQPFGFVLKQLACLLAPLK